MCSVQCSHLWNVGMMATCFEVRITLSDFRRGNGHNFHGNVNYRNMPSIQKLQPNQAMLRWKAPFPEYSYINPS